jgi:hypothetical protein
MIKTNIIGAACMAVLIFTVSCIGSTIPTTSPGAVGTIVEETMSAITPEATATSQPAPVPSVTSAPPTISPLIPTPVLPVATRINFLTGATTGIVSAPIQSGQIQYYVVNASQGQPMIVMVNSLNNDVTISIKTQGGTSMLNQSSHETTWQAMLPQTEDYYIGVYGGASSENYTLTVEIPSRIKFAEGTISASVIGKTVAGYVVAYTILALKGQKMTVNLNTQANSAALTIYGYTDGQPYLRSVTGQTKFVLKLPATQDYIIEVVPLAGQVVNFELDVNIQ